MGFPGGSEVKASACNVEDLGSIPGLKNSKKGILSRGNIMNKTSGKCIQIDGMSQEKDTLFIVAKQSMHGKLK